MNHAGSIIDRAALSRVPYAPKQYTGWVRATIATGHSLFGEEWNEAERARGAFGAAERSALIEAEVKRRMPLPQMTPASSSLKLALKSSPKPIGPEALERIRAAAEQKRSEREALAAEIDAETPPLRELAALNSRRRDMLEKAQAALFDAAVNSQVPAFWYRDGSHNLPPTLPPARLMALSSSHGGMINLHQRGYIWHEKGAWYVFVDSEALTLQYPLAPKAGDEAELLGMPHLSPYLRLMLHVARLENIGPNNQSKVEALAEQMRHHARAFGVTFSEKSLYPDYMARLIREPRL